MMRMVMKMAAASTISLLLLCFSAISATDPKCDRSAATGDNITLILSYTLSKSDRLTWMHGKDTILNRRGVNIISGNVNDIYENGSLKLTNLLKKNEGEYKPEVFGEDGKRKQDLKIIRLCVLDRVPVPTVTTDCKKTPNSVIFTCKVAQGKDLKFGWLKNNEVMVKETNPILTQVAKDVEKDSFSCKVSNAVSSMTATPVTQPCFKPKPIFPEKLFGINTWIFVGAGGGIVLVLIIVVIVCCIRTKRKKKMQMKEEGELRLAWTNEQEQHQHQHNHPPAHQHQHQHQHNHPPGQRHHHHHHEQQPAGHTGPRQPRSKQHRDQQRPRAPDQPKGHPQPSPRRPAQAPRPVDNVDEEQPPPLPQPRKKAAKTQRV